MTLPYSESAEGALVARLLVDPRPIPTLRLTADDFFVRQYGKAYRAMLSLVSQHKPIDLVTLRDEGVDLGDLLDSVTVAHHAPVEQYADIIRRDAFRRRYINELTDLAERAEFNDDTQALITALHDKAAVLSEGMALDDTLGRLNLSEHRGTPPDPWLGVLSPQGTTVLYGEGGDGKGWVAARLVSQLVAEGKRIAILDFETQAKEWAYRLDRFGTTPEQVLYFAPTTTMDRWATDTAARTLRDEQVDMIVVDSALYASNMDDPYSPNGAIEYGRARRRLNNVPALLLAHVPAGADKIFGSVMWRAEARVVWRLGKDALTRKRFLECRKANAYGWLEGKRLDIHFSEEQGELELIG